MSQFALFTGIIFFVFIIFIVDGQFDKSGIVALIDDLIKVGVDGLFFLGSGGEFFQFGVEERKVIVRFVIDYVDRRVSVLIGIGGINVREIIEFSQYAQQAGADGIVVINFYYWKVSEANLIRYFEQVVDSVTLSVMFYNFSALIGQDLISALVKIFVDSRSNIIGIKDIIDFVVYLRSMIYIVKGVYSYFIVFCGYDDYLFNILLFGGDGAISASGNFVSQVSVNFLKVWRDGDVAKAVGYYQILL